MRIVHEIAIVVLTDRAGRVLMQHRGPDAHPDPGRWTPPGGHLEPGEDALTAAVVADLAVSVLHIAVERWLEEPDDAVRPLADVLDEVLDRAMSLGAGPQR